ncbi:MAG: hypothetical protein KJ737_21650 [Proteobacteria bacterium]|nr:hypothetical protein [Pseudomonadota bacterium]
MEKNLNKPEYKGVKMNHMLENRIKNEIYQFNENLFDLIKGIDEQLELDEETFTIIENSNKLLIFCAVKDLNEKRIGDSVSVIYNEDAEVNPEIKHISFGRSLAQYRKFYQKSSGKCQTIQKKAPEFFLPDETLWSYKFRNYFLYQNLDGSYGLCYNDLV